MQRGCYRYTVCMIEAVIEDIAMSGEGTHFLVLLRTVEDEILPIVIDHLQAMSLVAARMEEKPERPHTHDLMLSMIEMLGATLERIEITDLKDGTFYGQVVLKRAGVEFDLDSRPSDALALAARADCPVLIARKVMEQHSYTDDELSGEGFEA